MTDTNTPDKSNLSDNTESSAKTSITSKPIKKASQSKKKHVTPKEKRSKTAIFALILALLSLAGTVGLFYFFSLQNKTEKDTLIQQLVEMNAASEKRLHQLVNNQQSIIEKQVNDTINKSNDASQLRIATLEKSLAAIKQRQSSDWLVHEAEYLIRLAARAMWLEHNTTTAIELLNDASTRLASLNDPQYLPIRLIIKEDIEALTINA